MLMWMWFREVTRFQSTPGLLLGLIFQTTPHLLRPFLRFGYGRRHLTFLHGVGLQLLVLNFALLLRDNLEQRGLYAPLQVMPPYNAMPANQDLWNSAETGLSQTDGAFFGWFVVAFTALALAHYLFLRVRIMRKVDPPNTRFWGESWLGLLPGLRSLSHPVLHTAIEPLFVLTIGYAFCAVAPAFGLWLMGGAVVLAIEHGAEWRANKTAELDARDAMVHAQVESQHFEEAQAHIDRVREAAMALMPEQALARVQRTPHALLALSHDETWATCELLGSDRFGELVDELDPSAQQQIYNQIAHTEAKSA